MKATSNLNLASGLAIGLLTAASAFFGPPPGMAEFRLPIWELLLQFNLCTGFIFMTLGVLEILEAPKPDFRSALSLFIAGFFAYGSVSAIHALSIPLPMSVQLFILSLSLACLGIGWCKFGTSLVTHLETADQ